MNRTKNIEIKKHCANIQYANENHLKRTSRRKRPKDVFNKESLKRHGCETAIHVISKPDCYSMITLSLSKGITGKWQSVSAKFPQALFFWSISSTFKRFKMLLGAVV